MGAANSAETFVMSLLMYILEFGQLFFLFAWLGIQFSKNRNPCNHENLHLKMPWPAKSTKHSEISDISDSDLSDEEAIDAKPTVKSNAQPRSQMEELESWMN